MQKMDFNRGWSVQREGEDVVKTVCLPHDAMILSPGAKMPPQPGPADTSGRKYIYRKTLQVPRTGRRRPFSWNARASTRTRRFR